jgi:hypothetical protein
MNPVTASRIRHVAVPILAVTLIASALAPVHAQRENVRNTTQTSLNQNRNTNVKADRNTKVNVRKNTNVNVNRNTNVHVNRNVNVNVNNRYGYYSHGPSVAGVVATAIVVGAIVHSLPPNCTTLVVNGLAYQNCGGTYYQPQYHGSSVTYVVVVHP